MSFLREKGLYIARISIYNGYCSRRGGKGTHSLAGRLGERGNLLLEIAGCWTPMLVKEKRITAARKKRGGLFALICDVSETACFTLVGGPLLE